MLDRKRLVAGAATALVLAGAALALRGAWAQDGLPNLTGTWTGASKGKFLSLNPSAKGGPSKSAFTADFTQSGSDLSVTLTNASDPPANLVGVVGNGTFWIVTEDASAPILIVGHSDKGAAHLKGGILIGNGGGAVDAKFTAGK